MLHEMYVLTAKNDIPIAVSDNKEKLEEFAYKWLNADGQVVAVGKWLSTTDERNFYCVYFTKYDTRNTLSIYRVSAVLLEKED